MTIKFQYKDDLLLAASDLDEKYEFELELEAAEILPFSKALR